VIPSLQIRKATFLICRGTEIKLVHIKLSHGIIFTPRLK